MPEPALLFGRLGIIYSICGELGNGGLIMIEICLNEVEQAYAIFKDKLCKFKEYIKHIETIPVHKRTFREKELIAKYGSKKG